MAKHLTARNIAEEFGETSRHWTKMAERGEVPGARRLKDGNGWLFDLDAFRAWHEGGQKSVAVAVRPPAAAVEEPPRPKRSAPTVKQRRVKAAIENEASRLVEAALRPKRP